MASIDDADELVLHPSRRFMLIYVFGGAAMAALGWMVAVPASGLSMVVGWAVLAFFSLCTVLFVIESIWYSHFGLVLDAQGFTVTRVLRRRRFRWKDLDRMFLVETLAFYPVVAFKNRGNPESQGLQSRRGSSRRPDGTLPQNLLVRERPLLDLVETWRLRKAAPTNSQEPASAL